MSSNVTSEAGAADPAPPRKPHASTVTTVPSNTFIDAKVTPGHGELVYWPEQNAFLALYPFEFLELHLEADEHSKKIAALQEANKKVTEAAVAMRAAQKSNVAAELKKAEEELNAALDEMQKASEEVKKKLEPLSKLDAKAGVKMVELVSLRTPKYKDKAVPIYVTSKRLRNVLAQNRIYLVPGEKAKRTKDNVFKNGKLNTKEIQQRIAEKAQAKDFKKEWKLKPDDADAYTGVLSEWARTMNGDIAKFIEREVDDVQKKFNIDPKDPQRNIDLAVDAQLMRYTAGAGLAVNFKPFQGNLFDARDTTKWESIKRGMASADMGIKANAKAAFAVAEGRVHTEVYYPHYAGWHASTEVVGEAVELGYWRFYGELVLSGSAGASLAVEVGLELCLTGGKQGVVGAAVPNQRKRVVKARAGGGGELQAFAGLTAGVDLKGALQWLNPEGAKSNGKPLKVKAGKAIAEYKDMAKVDVGVAATAGLGAKGSILIKHEGGKFVIYAKIGACLGLGGEGSIKFEAGFGTIGEFFKCLAYNLKRTDYHKIGDIIDKRAYEIYCQVKYLMVAAGSRIEEFVDKSVNEITSEFESTVEKINQAIDHGTAAGKEFLERIRGELEKETSSWFSYAPPEVSAQIARQVVAAGGSLDPSMRQEAPMLMAKILEAPQTMNHLSTIAERMTPVMGEKQDASTGFAAIDSCMAGTRYEGRLQAAEQRLAQAETLLSQPFIWNSSPEFIATKYGIEHSMYA